MSHYASKCPFLDMLGIAEYRYGREKLSSIHQAALSHDRNVDGWQVRYRIETRSGRMFPSNRHDLRGRHRRGRDGNYSIPLLAEEGWMRRAKRRRRRGGQTGETLRPN